MQPLPLPFVVLHVAALPTVDSDRESDICPLENLYSRGQTLHSETFLRDGGMFYKSYFCLPSIHFKRETQVWCFNLCDMGNKKLIIDMIIISPRV